MVDQNPIPADTNSLALEPGKLFRGPMGCAGLAGWVALKRHPTDRRLLFAVPADREPLVGTSDVRVLPEGPQELPLILRLASGVWLLASEIWHCEPHVRVARPDRVRALERLCALLDPTEQMAQRTQEEQSEAYREWQDGVVTPAMCALERWLGRERVEALPSSLDGEAGKTLDEQRRDLRPGLLAAETLGLSRDLGLAWKEPLRELDLPWASDRARLHVTASSAGLLPWLERLIDRGDAKGGGLPRVFAYYRDGTRIFADWAEDNGQRILGSRRVFPWENGEARIVVDRESVLEFLIHRLKLP